MYLVKLSVFKEKHQEEQGTAVEIPAFFRHEVTMEDVRKYVNRNFRDVATLYIEEVPDTSDYPIIMC